MIQLFCGYDEREAVGFHVFVHSVIKRATTPVSIIPLAAMGLPQGSNSFTLSRFLIPYLMGYQGTAIFADASDMLMLGDIAELAGMYDERYAVQVVKHSDYISRHQRKYIGTPMECEQSNYPRKNWASLMLINCGHEMWRSVNPAFLAQSYAVNTLMLSHCSDAIGELPDCWNRLIDEGHSLSDAKILHWTAGIPAFEHYRSSPGSDAWLSERNEMLGSM